MRCRVHGELFCWGTLWCKLALSECPRLILHKLCFDLFFLYNTVDTAWIQIPASTFEDLLYPGHAVGTMSPSGKGKPWATAQLKRMDGWNFSKWKCTGGDWFLCISLKRHSQSLDAYMSIRSSIHTERGGAWALCRKLRLPLKSTNLTANVACCNGTWGQFCRSKTKQGTISSIMCLRVSQ